jgi:D-alanine-D-alanine ligase
VKPVAEDNSRGVSLVKAGATVEDMKDRILAAFEYPGDFVLLEEFIPGRELRCGALQRRVAAADGSAAVEVIPAMCEYVMMNKDYPIRTATDKLQVNTGEGTKITQTKCERILPAQVEEAARKKIETSVVKAHKALGLRDYCLFDFRLHSETNEPYLIEACSFWSFSPISVISLLLGAAEMELEPRVLEAWRTAADRTQKMRTEAKWWLGSRTTFEDREVSGDDHASTASTVSS